MIREDAYTKIRIEHGPFVWTHVAPRQIMESPTIAFTVSSCAATVILFSAIALAPAAQLESTPVQFFTGGARVRNAVETLQNRDR